MRLSQESKVFQINFQICCKWKRLMCEGKQKGERERAERVVPVIIGKERRLRTIYYVMPRQAQVGKRWHHHKSIHLTTSTAGWGEMNCCSPRITTNLITLKRVATTLLTSLPPCLPLSLIWQIIQFYSHRFVAMQ